MQKLARSVCLLIQNVSDRHTHLYNHVPRVAKVRLTVMHITAHTNSTKFNSKRRKVSVVGQIWLFTKCSFGHQSAAQNDKILRLGRE